MVQNLQEKKREMLPFWNKQKSIQSFWLLEFDKPHGPDLILKNEYTVVKLDGLVYRKNWNIHFTFLPNVLYFQTLLQ